MDIFLYYIASIKSKPESIACEENMSLKFGIKIIIMYGQKRKFSMICLTQVQKIGKRFVKYDIIHAHKYELRHNTLYKYSEVDRVGDVTHTPIGSNHFNCYTFSN